MGVNFCGESHLEHVAIEYEGGSMTLRFREYTHKFKLFKHVDGYGQHNVVVSSSAWFEMKQTIKRHDYRTT